MSHLHFDNEPRAMHKKYEPRSRLAHLLPTKMKKRESQPPKSNVHDSDWEFNAPKFYDFDHLNESKKVDIWFDSEQAAQLEFDPNIEKENVQQANKNNKNKPKKASDPLMFTPVKTPKRQLKETAVVQEQPNKDNVAVNPQKAPTILGVKPDQKVKRKKVAAEPHRYQLTIPHTPKLLTAQRNRKIEREEVNVQPPKNNNDSQESKWEPKLTHPVPFKFHETVRRKEEIISHHSPFRTVQERLKEFDTKYSRPKRLFKPQLTVPQEFHFSTQQRIRPAALSSEDREQLEVESAPKFKPRAFNPNLFNNGAVGVAKVEKRGLTQPQEFHLSTTNKRSREVVDEQEEEQASKPAPKRRRTEAHREPVRRTLEMPDSPQLVTRNKQRLTSEAEESITQFKSKPAPSSVPFFPKLGVAPLTEPKPFNLRTESRRRTNAVNSSSLRS